MRLSTIDVQAVLNEPDESIHEHRLQPVDVQAPRTGQGQGQEEQRLQPFFVRQQQYVRHASVLEGLRLEPLQDEALLLVLLVPTGDVSFLQTWLHRRPNQSPNRHHLKTHLKTPYVFYVHSPLFHRHQHHHHLRVDGTVCIRLEPYIRAWDDVHVRFLRLRLLCKGVCGKLRIFLYSNSDSLSGFVQCFVTTTHSDPLGRLHEDGASFLFIFFNLETMRKKIFVLTFFSA